MVDCYCYILLLSLFKFYIDIDAWRMFYILLRRVQLLYLPFHIFQCAAKDFNLMYFPFSPKFYISIYYRRLIIICIGR